VRVEPVKELVRNRIPWRESRAQSFTQLVAEDRNRLREIHRRELGPCRNRCRSLTEHHFVARQAGSLSSEDDRQPVLLAKLLGRKLCNCIRRQVIVYLPGTNRRSGDGQMAVGERLLERVDSGGTIDDIDRSHGPPGGDAVRPLDLPPDDPEIGEAEVLHGTRCGTDIPRFHRFDQDDPYLHLEPFPRLKIQPGTDFADNRGVFGRRVTLFHLMGFAVRADASFLIILALVTWSLARGLFPQLYPDLSLNAYWLMAAAGAVILFLSVVVHELSHSVVARRYGIPIKGITLFVFGGVAEMHDEPPSPKSELLMALAGPAASVVISVVFLTAGAAVAVLGWRAEVVGVIQYVGFTNGLLAVFNMLPAFPLDGGRVLRAIIWWRKGEIRAATRVASNAGNIFGWLLIGAGFYTLITGNIIGGIWWLLIGSFLRHAATMSYQQVIVRQMLEGQPVTRFMNAAPITVSRSIPVSELVDEYIYRHHHSFFPVVSGDRLVGCVTAHDVKKLPREEWDQQTVGAIAHECDASNTIGVSEDAMQALTKMGRVGAKRLMVVDGERLAGLVGSKDLLQFLSLKMELEK
jgi:Zn-dependent protease/CBS domain-containing protein